MEWKELQAALAKQNYIASNELVVAIQLALSLERPLLLAVSYTHLTLPTILLV